ncbi:hypothetical protein UFOVP601_20 [uncultured Caudovirales phage]|uniref:Uncharacterized protein n=1 Tax=uncultured Caudovirales phage TaxID=2100421 RepID=A0A6J5MYL3_9CAUD|nr:hypothetical protein UFOVP601_20 [uncultured Caudovirales phage]
MPLVSKNFSDIITFTRASTGSYFDSAGVLQSAAINTPRLDYNPSTLASQGLLIEESRVNSATRSESLRTQTLTVVIVGGSFQNNETVTATGGGTGTYISANSTPTSFAVFNGTGTFTGTLTGGTSGATATISSVLNEWALTRATTAADVVAAPDGAVTADKLIEDTTASNTHQLASRSITVLATTAYALSIFLKAAERTWALVLFGGTPFGSHGVYINLSTGALGTTVGTLDSTPIVQTCGSGWFRVTLVKTTGAAGGGTIQVRTATADNTSSYTGDGTSGLYVWGAQFEAGAFATSYIPTSTVAVTRSADVARVNTLSPWFNATESTLYFEFTPVGMKTVGGTALVSIDNGSNERIALLAASNNGMQNITTVAGVTSGNSTTPSTIYAANTTYKVALAVNLNDIQSFVGGVAGTAGTTALMPSGLTSLQFNKTYAAATSNNGWIRRFTYYPRRLSSAEGIAITA